jgi:hypothetical protein
VKSYISRTSDIIRPLYTKKVVVIEFFISFEKWKGSLLTFAIVL